MAKTTSFVLGPHFTRFIKKEVEGGRYGSASDVMRDALRLLEERKAMREAQINAIRKHLRASLASGPAEPFSFEKMMAEEDAAREKRRRKSA